MNAMLRSTRTIPRAELPGKLNGRSRRVVNPSPPTNVEAEHDLAAAVLVAARNKDHIGDATRLFTEISATISSDELFDQFCRTVWRAMSDLCRRGQSLSAETVADELERQTGDDGRSLLDDIGGREKIYELESRLLTPAGWQHAAKLVRHASQRRALFYCGAELQRLAHHTPPDELLGQFEAVTSETRRVLEPVAQRKSTGVGEPVLTRLSDVWPERVAWLWPNRIALGKLSLIVGDPGLGKSLLTLDIAARVTTGRAWPDGTPNGAPGSVVLLTAEDDLADTVRPRIDAAGADASRVNALQTVLHDDPETGNIVPMPFNLERDLLALEQAITATAECRLVVIDPVAAYLGRVDAHKNADMRALLTPLAELAARHRVAVVAVHHLNKSIALPAIYRVTGSLAFVAAARAVWAVTRDPEDESGRRRFFLPVKCNLANDETGLAYAVICQPGLDAPVVVWESGPLSARVDVALNGDQGSDENSATAVAEAARWLQQALRNGPMPAKELRKKAKADGIADRTLRRAKSRIGVQTEKDGYGGDGRWLWKLPDAVDSKAVNTSPDLATWPHGHLRKNPEENAHLGGQPSIGGQLQMTGHLWDESDWGEV
jgi:hypothetical protein